MKSYSWFKFNSSIHILNIILFPPCSKNLISTARKRSPPPQRGSSSRKLTEATGFPLIFNNGKRIIKYSCVIVVSRRHLVCQSISLCLTFSSCARMLELLTAPAGGANQITTKTGGGGREGGREGAALIDYFNTTDDCKSTMQSRGCQADEWFDTNDGFFTCNFFLLSILAKKSSQRTSFDIWQTWN